MSGSMRNPCGSATPERKTTFSASERPSKMSSTLIQGQVKKNQAETREKQLGLTILCAMEEKQRYRVSRFGRTMMAFHGRRVFSAQNTDGPRMSSRPEWRTVARKPALRM